MTSRSSALIVGTVLVIGSGFTVYGLNQVSVAELISANKSFYLNALYFSVAVAVMVEGGARWFCISRLTAGCVVSLMIAMAAGVVWQFIVCIWFVLSSFLLGAGLLKVFKINRQSLSGISVFLVGALAYATGIGLLAHFPANYPGTYGVALVLPVVLGWRTLSGTFKYFSGFFSPDTESRYLKLAIVIVSLLLFAAALMPELGHDALAMHLFIPGHLYHNHLWNFDVTTYVWAVMPMLGRSPTGQ